ncbi:MAG: exodeoxyribonuclease VII large subunit [Lentisphaerae bacterium RIFOXYC12_FULL_60_16]|nr:MAG: exodeoxyribonuclease VII large subunit [Lentisphaerae bacterium RIFOXYC12_FULL_60_16]OGV86134.1 MAG: exodeoxyribonuclease VII large subunit [Lentisphaerae bacterium RIFOXYB12_FULL_60_10]
MIVRAAGWQKPVSDTIPVKALTVTELTRRIRAALEQGIGPVVVEGEVSNVRRPSSGHCYFTLKDETAQIAAVLFRGVLETLRIVPKDGLQVRVRGELTVYEKNGNYQILVRHLEETGRGSLQARFEQLKSRLQQEGLFDAARKRPLPVLPRHIGIVTSPTGAAIRDILQVLSRRFPNLHVLVAPVRVQGDGAAEAIAAAIDRLNQRADLDVLIIGRGGGSLEDLWAFNEEVVARAVFRSRLPVISAVGHEIDFTISDFVADVRAPTPSAAAEIVVRAKADWLEQLNTLAGRIRQPLESALRDGRGRLKGIRAHYVFREPHNLVQAYRDRLDSFFKRLIRGTEAYGRERHQRLDDAGLRLIHGMRLACQSATQDIRRIRDNLAALSPLAVLDRGYSVTRDSRGRIIRRAAGVPPGEVLVTTLASGRIESQVVKVLEGRQSDLNASQEAVHDNG